MVTKAIEKQTIKLPSDTFLFAAMGAGAISLVLKCMGKERYVSFVGHWWHHQSFLEMKS